MSERQRHYEDFLMCRGIDDPADACEECGGLGVKGYPTTATWRGGAGGMSITQDVCNKCWGSGHKHRPWPSHRLLAASLRSPGQGGEP